MIRFSLGIPISISPFFWVFAALIGFIFTGSLIGTFMWIGIIFVSVLFHELGHALMALVFGKKPKIELVAMGGLTTHNAQDLSYFKQFLIVFNGPFFGFLLFLFMAFLLHVPAVRSSNMAPVVEIMRNVNLFWTIVNLLPVMPLDGGQLMRILLQAIFGFKGMRYSLIASVIVAGGLSLYFFMNRGFLIGALFSLLAFQSYVNYRQSKVLTGKDQDEDLKNRFTDAEKDLVAGHKQSASDKFTRLREESKSGLLYTLSTQYLAFLTFNEGKTKEAYQLLRSVKEQLSSDALRLLHQLAFQEEDYPLVVELSGNCFKESQTAEIALRNAYACASVSQVEPSIGWLKAALEKGVENLQEIVQESSFDNVRNDPEFRKFIHSLES